MNMVSKRTEWQDKAAHLDDVSTLSPSSSGGILMNHRKTTKVDRDLT